MKTGIENLAYGWQHLGRCDYWYWGAEDHPLGELLCEVRNGIGYNLSGQTSYMESAEALKRCRLYVGNDNGTTHLAAAVGTPCVTIFFFPGSARGMVSIRERPNRLSQRCGVSGVHAGRVRKREDEMHSKRDCR